MECWKYGYDWNKKNWQNQILTLNNSQGVGI